MSELNEEPIVPIESDTTPAPPATPAEPDAEVAQAVPVTESFDLTIPVLEVLTNPDL